MRAIDLYSYYPGERIKLKVRLGRDGRSFPGLSEYVSNINIVRINTERDSLRFGTSFDIDVSDDHLSTIISLPSDIERGLYFIPDFQIISNQGNISRRASELSEYSPTFFFVSNLLEGRLDQEDLKYLVNDAEVKRLKYINHPLSMENCGPDNLIKFSSYVLMSGCLIGGRQFIKGAIINPLQTSFSPHDIYRVAAEYSASKRLTLGEFPDLQSTYQNANPLFSIEIPNVVAASAEEARTISLEHCDAISNVLAMSRGQKPIAFFSAVVNTKDNTGVCGFHFDSYRGNLIIDYDPSRTGSEIDRLLPSIKKHSLARIIVEAYASALSARDSDTMYFRYWSILEIVAKRNISDNESPIFRWDGRAIMIGSKPATTKQTVAKVYKYLTDNNIGTSSGSSSVNGLSVDVSISGSADTFVSDRKIEVLLWDMVMCIYLIRNQVGHEGGLNIDKLRTGSPEERLSAFLIDSPHFGLLNNLENWCRIAVMKEVAAMEIG